MMNVLKNWKKSLALVGATAVLATGMTVAPTAMAQPGSVVGPPAAEAATFWHWGKSCGPNRGYRTVPQGQGYYTHYEQRLRVYWGGITRCMDTGYRVTNRQPVPFGLPYWWK